MARIPDYRIGVLCTAYGNKTASPCYNRKKPHGGSGGVIGGDIESMGRLRGAITCAARDPPIILKSREEKLIVS